MTGGSVCSVGGGRWAPCSSLCLTCNAAQSELPAAHPLHKPHPQEGEQEVGEGGEPCQPDRQPVVTHSRHLQDGGAVVPEETVKKKKVG